MLHASFQFSGFFDFRFIIVRAAGAVAEDSPRVTAFAGKYSGVPVKPTLRGG